ncbi:hypothetical protein [Parendozoicomonas haliclonae]|uniref:Uncharacterized protein n=1 Tax=Parendozoicomonas haliclonae TaxID=1960125 RepID=A0A1X7AEZ3_9GAMM|nr:hypothetical protein [Parendozoicomonas haliclonae]SMA33591.1 hypothetical protein EHSB41UT_00302 [Parendozoicomonas haliclonae]
MTDFEKAMGEHFTPEYQQCFGMDAIEVLEELFTRYQIPPGVALAALFLRMFNMDTPDVLKVWVEIHHAAKTHNSPEKKVTLQ